MLLLPLGDSGQGCDLTSASIGAAGGEWYATYDDLLHSTCCLTASPANTPKNAHVLFYAPVFPDFNISEIQPYCCECRRMFPRPRRAACFAVRVSPMALHSEPQATLSCTT